MGLKTDFNVSPYFDDFSIDNGFHRILFRPATAVQARELTQLQTILQNQISKGSDYHFKDGSVIDGCGIIYESKLDYVHLEDTFNSDSSLTISSIANNYVIASSQDGNTAIKASVVLTKAGFAGSYPNTSRAYLKYVTSGTDAANNIIDKFASGDTLYVYNNLQSATSTTLDANNYIGDISVITGNSSVNAVGQGYGVTVTDGTVYQKGFFSKFNKETVLVKEFDTNPNNYVVGFETEESIVTPEQDITLYDNSLGSTNYNAPGAHRLKLTPRLVAKLRTETANNKNFFAIVEFDSDKPTQQNTGEEILNKTRDVIATRTFEESGNYTVKPFTIEAIPNSSNTALFDYSISPGIIYVNGYRVEKINGYTVSASRETNYNSTEAQIITANFGSYVVVDQVVGNFNMDQLDEIDLYDTAQNSISDVEGASASLAGTKIGTANVRGFAHSSGKKGLGDTQYYLYLFNIKMNASKSFSDVKSFYSPDTDAKADAVLELDGTVKLKEINKNSLVFPTGYKAIKTLRDTSSQSDNQFVIIDTATSTLNANGFTTFTINTPHNGGSERLNASGTLTDIVENEFNIILSSAAYTQDLSGTVSVTNQVVTGSNTTFTTDFANGDLIRLNANSEIHEITEVINSTSMTLSSNASVVASAYQKSYLAGHIVDLTRSGAQITVISNTQFTVQTGLGLGSDIATGTQSITAQYPILRYDAYETKKEINKNRFVKIDLANNAASNTSGPFDLGVTDLHKVRHIYLGVDYDETNDDRVDWFVIDNGQKDAYYEHAKLIVKPEYASRLNANTKLLVEMDYFTANTSAGIGFYSVDSYPIDDANTANTTAIRTAEIPLYISNSTGETVDLRNAVDFRPRKFNSATNATTANTATINPAVSNTSFDIPTNGQYLVSSGSNFQADLDYYLSRIDLVCLSQDGRTIIKSGTPDVYPLEPNIGEDLSVLARNDVPPYPSLTQREGSIFNRSDITMSTSFRLTKRYRMKDIGNLEKRIKSLEYYTSLNALEKQAKDLVILDENGLNRFKNGIFADGFKSHLIGKVRDFEYKISIDESKGIARPLFDKHVPDLYFDSNSSVTVQRTGNIVTLPYVHEMFASQRFATKYRNATESYWKWNGRLTLTPNFDHFRNEKAAPAVNVTLDLTQPWTAFANSPFASRFGDWRVTNSSSESDTTRRGNVTSTTTTTTTTSQRQIDRLVIDNIVTEKFDLGNFVTDVSISPFMRSRIVEFSATGLKPNTRVYPFFDDILVSDHCRPGSLTGNGYSDEFLRERLVQRLILPLDNFGTELVTDTSGKVSGQFRIPENTFRVGDRTFILTNVDNLETGASARITSASAQYTASNVTNTKQSTSITTIQPTIESVSSTQTTTTTNTRTNIVITEPPREESGISRRDEGGRNERGDPVAQSFLIETPTYNSGVFVTKIGVYFKSKSSTEGVTLTVNEMISGYPTKTVLAKKRIEASAVSVSDDASVETVFTLTEPLFLYNSKEYCFVVEPDGSSPEYEIWTAEIGNYDVSTDEQVFRNPTFGNMYISSNKSGWTALQTEDIKFNIYRAKFTSQTGTAIFYNEDDDYITYNGLVKANTSASVLVGDIVVKVDANNNPITNTSSASYAIGEVQEIDLINDTLILNASNGNFANGDTIAIHRSLSNTSLSNTTLIANTTIETVDNKSYHTVVPRFSYITPDSTNVDLKFKGYDSLKVVDSAFKKLINDYDYDFLDKTRVLYSKSNSTGGNPTLIYNLDLVGSASGYVSPAIDLRKKSSLLIENLINNDSTDEHTRYGSAISKYISSNVILDDRLGDAEDMKVFVTAYRPVGTDFEVYVKLHGSDDGDPYDDKFWTKMTVTNGGVYSSPIDTEDYVEYEFDMPSTILHTDTESDITTAYLNPLNEDIVEYTRADGGIIKGFKTFNFKIVLLSEDGYRVPRLNDIRAIALQK